MAKQNASSSTPEQVINENLTVDVPAETNVPEFLKPILEQRKIEDEANEQTLAQLKTDLKTANQNYFTVFSANGFEPTPETEGLSLLVKKADTAIVDFNKTLELLKAERSVNDSLNVARYDLIDKLGIPSEKLDELLAASKDVKDTLKTSFAAFFGKPTIYAKQGATGKDVSKLIGASVSRETLNGENPEKPGTKGAEAYQALVSGTTHDELLQMYPTVKDDVKDFTKLNGTVRVIIDRYKFRKQADGSYAIEAAK